MKKLKLHLFIFLVQALCYSQGTLSPSNIASVGNAGFTNAKFTISNVTSTTFVINFEGSYNENALIPGFIKNGQVLNSGNLQVAYVSNIESDNKQINFPFREWQSATLLSYGGNYGGTDAFYYAYRSKSSINTMAFTPLMTMALPENVIWSGSGRIKYVGGTGSTSNQPIKRRGLPVESKIWGSSQNPAVTAQGQTLSSGVKGFYFKYVNTSGDNAIPDVGTGAGFVYDNKVVGNATTWRNRNRGAYAKIQYSVLITKKCNGNEPLNNISQVSSSCMTSEGFSVTNVNPTYDWVAGSGNDIDFKKYVSLSSGTLEVYRIGINGVLTLIASTNNIMNTSPWDNNGLTCYLLVRKDANGCRCKLNTINFNFRSCAQCYAGTWNTDVLTNSGNYKNYNRQNKVFLCSDNNIFGFYKSINLKYNCQSRTYSANGIGNDGVSIINVFGDVTGFNPESLRSGCQSCGTLKDFQSVFAFRKPISTNAVQPPATSNYNPYDYVIDAKTSTFNLTPNRWRTQVVTSPGVASYNVYAQTPGGSETLMHSLNLNNNIANAPGTANINPTSITDNEIYSTGLTNCSSVWVNQSGSDSALRWIEKLSRNNQTPIDCRTFVVNTWEPNQGSPLVAFNSVRVKVCNPCSTGLSSISNADFKLSIKGKPLDLITRKVLTNSFRTNATANNQIEVSLNKNWFPCANSTNSIFITEDYSSSVVINQELSCGTNYAGTAWNRTGVIEKLDLAETDLETTNAKTEVEPVSNGSEIFIAPNPVKDDLTIELRTSQRGIAHCTVRDVYGSVQFLGKISCNGGLCRGLLKTDVLKQGVFVLQVVINNEVLTTKFIKI